MKALVATLGLVIACGDHRTSEVTATAKETADRTPRVIDPPPQNVRALPPHAIRPDGVGPFKVGLMLERIATQIPSGGRNTQVDIPDVVHLSVLHAEEDGIQIGGEPLGRATFVAVISPQIARTEAGIQVGSSREDLGTLALDYDRARDPRIAMPAKQRELRAVTDGERVIGLVVAAGETPAKQDGCVRGTDDKKIGACIAGAPGWIALEGDEVIVRDPNDKVLGKSGHLPGAKWIAPIRTADGRDDVVAVLRVDEPATKTWMLVELRWEAERLVRVVDAQIYKLTATNVRWIGAALQDVDLAIEVANRGDAFEVGGLLTTRAGEKLRDLLVLSPVTVPRKRAKPATTDVPAPVPADAGIEAGSDVSASPKP
ncbi:MAG: hypothetical protein QM831_01845 [Kofleriaceae bacterium]